MHIALSVFGVLAVQNGLDTCLTDEQILVYDIAYDLPDRWFYPDFPDPRVRFVALLVQVRLLTG